MPYQQKPGQGSLFQNKKRSSDKAPNLKGTALVQVGNNIVELDLAAWDRESERAGKWLSLTVKAKSVRPNRDMEMALGRDPGQDDDIDY